MLDLPHSFLLLPPLSSNHFAKTLRKVHLSAVRFLLTAPRSQVDDGLQQKSRALQTILTRILKQDPARLLRSIARQDVLTPLRILQLGIGDPNQMFVNMVTNILVDLQFLPEDFLWDVKIDTLIDVEQRRILRFEPSILGFAIGPAGIVVRLHCGTHVSWKDIESHSIVEQPFVELPAKCFLSTFDSNPLANQEDHPDKDGNRIDLGGKPQADWHSSLTQSFALIEETIPEWWSEFSLFMNRIVPVGFHAEQHLSASYAEALGLAYVSLHPDPLIMAEAIVHESQHSKLNALIWLDPVLTNGHSEWTSSPVRPDLRPLIGVMLAAHAFVPVSAMHARMKAARHPLCQQPSFQRRSRDVLSSNARALETLRQKSRPTPLGKRILTGLMELDSAARSYLTAGSR